MIYDPDWNELIELLNKKYTQLYNDNLITEESKELKNSFMEQVLMNAPSQAQDILYQIQEL